MSTIFFTLPHNNPAGGVKVVNEYVQLLNKNGLNSILCLPEENLEQATFLSNPAPVISLSELVLVSTKDDIIIMCWQSSKEYTAFKSAKAKLKIFWQHGILSPVSDGMIGDIVLKEKVFDQYWNVSHACANFISEHYSINKFKVLSPFYSESNPPSSESKKSGFLIVERRGSSQIQRIKEKIISLGETVTVISGKYPSDHFNNLLKSHKFFISIDNGIKHNFKERIRNKLKPKWQYYKKNLLGFPVPPLEAISHETVVIGYAMGGGLEYMTPSSIFLAEDDNLESLLDKIQEAIQTSDSELDKMKQSATQAISNFNEAESLKQIITNLEI